MATALLTEDEMEAQLLDMDAQLQSASDKHGVTPDELTQLHDLAEAYREKRQTKRLRAQDAQAATADFKTVDDEARPFISNLRQRMNLHPTMTDEARQTYHLVKRSGRRSVVAPPDEAPLLRLDFGTRGRMTINAGPNPGGRRGNAKPRGAAGIVIQFHAGGAPADESGWTHLVQISSSPFVHEPGGNALLSVAYRACYVNTQGERGPWSETATGTITP